MRSNEPHAPISAASPQRLRLTIPVRLALLVAAAVLMILATFAVHLRTLRHTLVDERQTALRNEVAVAITAMRYFVGEAQAGRLDKAEAQTRAKAMMRSIRFGKGDYFFVYDYDGVNVAHGLRPEFEGKNLLDLKDARGEAFNAELIRAARAGGGFVTFLFARAGESEPKLKLGYAAAVEEWQWVVGSGVYIDDIDVIFRDKLIEALMWSAGFLVLLGLVAWPMARGMVVPLGGLTGMMKSLASGDFTAEVPATERADEIGDMARAVQVFKREMAETEHLRQQQREQEARNAAEQRATLDGIAKDFEHEVGGIVAAFVEQSAEMRGASQTLNGTADSATRNAATVAAAAEEATSNVETVAAAAEELSASIDEIARQVTQSSEVAKNAAEQAERTNETVDSLNEAARKIGDVISLIQDIASQTNLLALNATIEAARAGDAGKGFAVVASEVKTLANQTARATEDISAQISAIQGATGEAVGAIKEIARTIGQINEISSAISAAVQEQGAATQEIAGNIQQAAAGTHEVSRSIAGVTTAAKEVNGAAGHVLKSANSLSERSDLLRNKVAGFLDMVRKR